MPDDFRAAVSHRYPPHVPLLQDARRTGDGAGRDADLHTTIDPESNSVAIIVKHLAGNLRSRFSDFLTTDGEKPDRNRDGEFEMPDRASREEMLRWWESGWTIALTSIGSLTPADLDRTVTIRGESFLVVEQLNRLAAHAAYHVGQIVFLAKHFARIELDVAHDPERPVRPGRSWDLQEDVRI